MIAERSDRNRVLDALWEDLMSLYHEAQAVTIVGKDGVERPYRPTRYLNEIRKGKANNELVPTVARIIRRPTHGLGILAEAGRPDLMVETRVVLDENKPYHHLFTPRTLELARERLREAGLSPTDARRPSSAG
ncbi:MAG: hypothetical protein M3P44_01550 [Actinomycetota bacterium]|nr:hypothetical protein [Actinomycetota bacterium]